MNASAPMAGRDRGYCWYLSQQGTVQEWVRTQRYKLYRSGQRYDITRDPMEQQPLTAMTPEVTVVHTLLQQALDQYSEARPAELLDLP
jgi:hypothetical protein